MGKEGKYTVNCCVCYEDDEGLHSCPATFELTEAEMITAITDYLSFHHAELDEIEIEEIEGNKSNFYIQSIC